MRGHTSDHEHGPEESPGPRAHRTHPHDWHRNILETRLTAEGRSVMADADARAVRVERALAAEFTDEERDALVGPLGRCVELLEEERP
nr:hypothetical protein [Actinacidiphila oryziradicis]